MKLKTPIAWSGKIVFFILLMAAAFNYTPPAFAQGTAFSYQGELNNNGSPANGNYDFTFSLYTNATTGTVVTGPITNAAVTVSNGVFSTTIDFGAGVFNGTQYWLSLAVRTNGSGAFVTLTNRQIILAVPYAIYASNANAAITANTANSATSVTSGSITAAGIASGQVVKSIDGLHDAVILAPGASIAFNTNGNTITISSPGSGWGLNGNSGTVNGNNFLGTIDNQALDLRVNNQRAFRIEPDASGANDPNVIGGSPVNYDSVSIGSAIGGGYGNIINHGTNGVVSGGFSNVVAYSYDSFVGGGFYNTVGNFGSYSVIVGGQLNTLTGLYSAIGGGYSNFISSGDATIAGGSYNRINSGNPYTDASIGGGFSNVIDNFARESTISGGYQNYVGPSATFATIGGGGDNTNNASNATIGGGAYNTLNAFGSTIAGGQRNSINGFGFSYSAIGGGQSNLIDLNINYGTIAGGQGNWLKPYAFYSTISGGQSNSIDESIGATGGAVIAGGAFNSILESLAGYGTISGGFSNQIQFVADYAAIGGGYNNVIGQGGGDDSSYSVISGGFFNLISANSEYSVISGGSHNNSSGSFQFIGGGQSNTNLANYSVIAGGQNNTISNSSFNSFLGSGVQNKATSGGYQVVAGGYQNVASNNSSTVSGGYTGMAGGGYSTVPGGYQNMAMGQASFAAGSYAQALNDYSFVWNDGLAQGSGPLATTAPSQFLIHATGGVGINSQPNTSTALTVSGGIAADTLSVNGVVTFSNYVTINGILSTGNTYTGGLTDFGDAQINGNCVVSGNVAAHQVCGTVQCPSDRNIKENFSDVNDREILNQVIGMPVTRWNYTNDAPAIKHIGPMAQDFSAAFHVGEDDKHITVIDEGGVAFAAIKGLNQKLEDELKTKNSEIQKLNDKNAALEKKFNELAELVKGLAASK